MQSLNYETYLKKLHGCYLGKAVGGTLGMPREGTLTMAEVSYYDPVPDAMVGNDDLDLQVIALEVIRRYGLPVNARDLAHCFIDHIRFYPDEYGVAAKNLSVGVYPPLSGKYGSRFGAGMGAAIRSELWAALAPNQPELAVRLCREDAVNDHYGDGVDACIFLTAVESAAFTCHDREKLIATGLHYIQHNVRMTEAFTNVHKWWDELHNVKAVREQVLAHYLSDNWTDVTINLSFILLAWLAGEGDFGRSICLASSLGYDADCTCATLGAILGLIDPDGIEEKWSRPIGNQLVLSDNIIAMHEPPTISEFIALVGETHAGGQPLLRRVGSVAAGKRASRMAWCVGRDETGLRLWRRRRIPSWRRCVRWRCGCAGRRDWSSPAGRSIPWRLPSPTCRKRPWRAM